MIDEMITNLILAAVVWSLGQIRGLLKDILKELRRDNNHDA